MTRLPASSPPPAGNPRDSGFVLVAALWIMAALAALASVYSVYTIRTASESHVLDDRVQAEASIRAGVEMTAYLELSAPDKAKPSQGRFMVRVGRTSVAVRFRPEAARIDLNAAPADLLTGLFVAAGVDPNLAKAFADRVVGWRTKPDAGVGSKEAQLYAQQGIAYPPRQAPFDNPLELTLLPGMPQSVVERVLPFVTVFSGRAEVDALSAEPTVLAALPGMTPEILKGFLTARAKNPNDRDALLQLLGPAKARAAADNNSKVFRVGVQVDFDRGRTVRSEVVFRLKNGADEPYDLLYWRDDFDDPTPLAWNLDR
jgi:general secretion pathway protein K